MKFDLRRLSKRDRDRLFGFIGYGLLSAPIWFLGMEEGTGRCTAKEFRSNLIKRTKFRPIMDLCEAHRQLRFRGSVLNIAEAASFGTWVWPLMAQLTALLTNAEIPAWQAAKDYVRRYLGQNRGQTLLLEIQPLPARSMGEWPYRGCTREQLIQKRIELIRKLVKRHRPKWIVAYGAGHFDKYRQVFDGTDWREMMVQQGPRSLRCFLGQYRSTRVLLLPFLGRGGIGQDGIRHLSIEMASIG